MTMDEQVQKAVDCYNAGATVLHVHVRELDGKGSKRLSKFNELLARLRVAVPDMVLQVGGSISFAPEGEGDAAKWLSDDTRHMLAELTPEARPGDDRDQHQPDEHRRADVRGRPRRHVAGRAGRLQRLPRDDVPGRPGLGRGARPPPAAQRHPERTSSSTTSTQLETVERMIRRGVYKGPLVLNWVAIGGGLDAPEHLQPGQLRARRARRRGADARELACSTCCRST